MGRSYMMCDLIYYEFTDAISQSLQQKHVNNML